MGMEILSALVKTKTSEELLSRISLELVNQGYVREGYQEELLKREKTYPTGLAFNGDFHVAIPHANIDFTKKEVLVVAKTRDEPIDFHRMDEPAILIPVDTVFLFAIKESKRYIQFLSDFLGVLGNKKCQETIKQLSPKKTVQTLIDALPQYDFKYEGFLL
jgi:PTS system galactitol-specific IIA component